MWLKSQTAKCGERDQRESQDLSHHLLLIQKKKNVYPHLVSPSLSHTQTYSHPQDLSSNTADKHLYHMKSPRSEAGVGAGGSKAKQEVDLSASPQGNKLHPSHQRARQHPSANHSPTSTNLNDGRLVWARLQLAEVIPVKSHSRGGITKVGKNSTISQLFQISVEDWSQHYVLVIFLYLVCVPLSLFPMRKLMYLSFNARLSCSHFNVLFDKFPTAVFQFKFSCDNCWLKLCSLTWNAVKLQWQPDEILGADFHFVHLLKNNKTLNSKIPF